MSNITRKNESLITTQLEKTTSLKSLKDLVRVKDAESVMLVLDCSGSMDWRMANGKRRIEGLREIVGSVLSKRAAPMIAFGPAFMDGRWGSENESVFSDGSRCVGFVQSAAEIPEPAGGTPMKEAIVFAGTQGAGRLLMISDGTPMDRMGVLEAASAFGGRIDVVYVGDPGDPGSAFMDELAKRTGGNRFEGDMTDVKELSGTVLALLCGETLEEVDEDDDEDDDDEDADDDI
jgi:hypothetical protein